MSVQRPAKALLAREGLLNVGPASSEMFGNSGEEQGKVECTVH